jgi:integrase
MQGQVIKRGEGRWLVRVAMGRNAAGTRIYHSKTIRGTKKDALQYLTLKLRELDTGLLTETRKETVECYLKRWLSTCAAMKVRARTLEDYSALVDRYLIPSFGHKQLSALGTSDMNLLYKSMIDRGLSSRTVRYVHSVLHNALEEALKLGQLARNPAKLATLPKKTTKIMQSLSQETATRFLCEAKDDRFFALWMLLLTSGLRPGEALALRWSDLVADRLQIQRSLSRRGDGSWAMLEPKTARARRSLNLPHTTVVVLREHRRLQLQERLAAGAAWTDLDLVFPNQAGNPLEWRVIARRHFRPIAKRAGVPSLRPYDLRHSCASLLLAAGANVKVVSERLGHHSAALTLDVYSHVLPDMQERAAEQLERALFG